MEPWGQNGTFCAPHGAASAITTTRLLSDLRALRVDDIPVWSLSVAGCRLSWVRTTVPLSRTLTMLSLRAAVGPQRPYSRSVSPDAHGE